MTSTRPHRSAFPRAASISALAALTAACASNEHIGKTDGGPAPYVKPAAQSASVPAASAPAPAKYDLKAHYAKATYRIPMRDGAHLFTQVFTPLDRSQSYPILMNRTPYSVAPYGEADFPDVAGSWESFARDGFILVKQDVRGRHMSEGQFVDMRPHIAAKSSPPAATEIDESTDTYDTIQWLLANVPGHNGRVGQWGISYPGFYSAAGMIDAHPALKAVSPQAPVADWFFDDFFHHGAFFLPHFFGFFYSFGVERPVPVPSYGRRFDFPTPDGYHFYLNLGPLKNITDRYFHNDIAFWNQVREHPAYDSFWQARSILHHLKNVAPAVMVVGGWFDAEDLYGALNVYQSIEAKNPSIYNVLVMGPWSHGEWSRQASPIGDIDFGAATSDDFRQTIQLPFFRHFLKDDPASPPPEASVFDTGALAWRSFPTWPPKHVEAKTLHLGPGGALSFSAPDAPTEPLYDEFISDPHNPAPYTQAIATGMTREYMTEDQRFASRRPDVLTYQTAPLETELTLAGPILADLVVSTTAGDADWIVKLIDVFPDDAKTPPAPVVPTPPGLFPARPPVPLAGYQMLIRSEAFRGRYRNSYQHPEPFTPNTPTHVKVPLQDVLHTFKPGHRLMIQIQSTWFPLVDRNPQKYVPNIFQAEESDFIRATHRVYLGGQSEIEVDVLNVR